MDRKKELKAQYKLFKPDMGIYAIRSKSDDYCFIDYATNLKSIFNANKFKLKYGSFKDKILQEKWFQLGEDNFEFEILEILEYDKDESKTDYSKDLKVLLDYYKSKK